ncbi:MAG: hypothetical protein Q4F57_02520 [Weeksellaceae bacterium]|nr:hypothetical protein [Weeksellaceae bacterium]
MRTLRIHQFGTAAEIPEEGTYLADRPDTLFVFQTDDRSCEFYMTDNAGLFLKVKQITGTYQSVQDALDSIASTRRYVGRIISVKNQYEQINLHWFRDGIEDEDLIPFAPSLENVMANGNELPKGQKIVFVSTSETNVPDEYRDQFENQYRLGIHTGLDGTNVIFSDTALELVSDDVVMSGNVVLGANSLANQEGPAFGIVALGNSALNRMKTGGASTAIGNAALYEYEGTKEDERYKQYDGFGKQAYNVAVGYWSGRGLKEGSGNIYIGSFTGSRPAEEWNTLVIHSSNSHTGSGQTVGSVTSPNQVGYPLLLGKFDERWFQVAGKIRTNNHQNPVVTDFAEVNELYAARRSGTSTYRELVPVNKVDFVKNILLSNGFSLTEAEKDLLAEKLGLVRK